MKVYLSARYSRKDEIATHARCLRDCDIEVTSTWFNEPHEGTVKICQFDESLLREYAARDLEEIANADVFIFFSESEQTLNRRGGRHVEYGYALALGRPIWVVGPKENIFHFLSSVTHFNSIEEFIRAGAGP